jgi:hypothetical protein
LTTDTFTIQGGKNKVKLEIDGENKNDCDESGDGNNNPECEIDSTKDIGPNKNIVSKRNTVHTSFFYFFVYFMY